MVTVSYLSKSLGALVVGSLLVAAGNSAATAQINDSLRIQTIQDDPSMADGFVYVMQPRDIPIEVSQANSGQRNAGQGGDTDQRNAGQGNGDQDDTGQGNTGQRNAN